jgi:hypothetical protein
MLVYRDIPVVEIHNWSIDAGGVVRGSSLEDIRLELERIHPCEHPDCTFVFRHRHDHRPNRWDKSQWEDLWLITARPICRSADFNTQLQASLALGPILVRHENLSDEVSEENGMTSVYLTRGFTRINYNPGAIARRPRDRQRREVRKQNRGYFDDDQLWQLYNVLRNWPGDHPFHGVVSPQESWLRGGWGSCKQNKFSVKEVVELKNATLKLWKEKFWRREDSYIRETLKPILPYLYAFEDQAKAKRDELTAEYNEEVENREAGRDVPSFQEFVSCMRGDTFQYELELCRWIRAEVRALGMKMPGRPKMPALPKRKRKKKRRKRKRVQSKVRSKRLADAPEET